MAISPQEAGMWTEADEKHLAGLEQLIDRCLRENILHGHELIFTTRGMTHRNRVEMMRRYEAVGWKVTHVCDQREGDYLSFEP